MRQYTNLNRSNNYNIKKTFDSFTQKFQLFILTILSLLLIITTKINPNIQHKISKIFLDISMPINQIISTPFNKTIYSLDYIKSLIDAKKENIFLREENIKLKSLYSQYLNIKKENEELQSIIAFAKPHFNKFKASQIIGKTNQIFTSRVFVKIDKNQANIGSIAFGKISMIGRVIDISDDRGLIMLINDEKSRIPVISSNSRIRSILAGNNSDVMKLIYLPKNHNIKSGEQIFSSGDGDVITSGMLLGVVTNVSENKVEVKMIENIANLNFIGISNITSDKNNNSVYENDNEEQDSQ